MFTDVVKLQVLILRMQVFMMNLMVGLLVGWIAQYRTSFNFYFRQSHIGWGYVLNPVLVAGLEVGPELL